MASVAMLEKEEGERRGVGVVVDASGKIVAVGYDSEIDTMMEGRRSYIRYSSSTARAALLSHAYNYLFAPRPHILNLERCLC